MTNKPKIGKKCKTLPEFVTEINKLTSKAYGMAVVIFTEINGEDIATSHQYGAKDGDLETASRLMSLYENGIKRDYKTEKGLKRAADKTRAVAH